MEHMSEEPWTKPLQQVLSTEEWEYERLLEGPDLSPGVSADSHEIIPSLLFLGSQDAARSVVNEGIRSVCCCLDNIKENELGEYAANGIDSMSMENFHDGSLGLLDPFVENGADFVAQQLPLQTFFLFLPTTLHRFQVLQHLQVPPPLQHQIKLVKSYCKSWINYHRMEKKTKKY